MDQGEEKTVDEALLDAIALEAASHLRRLGRPLPVSALVEELRRNGAPAEEAADAIDHGISTGALVMLGEAVVDAGIVRGWL